jgi:hypothetical protein
MDTALSTAAAGGIDGEVQLFSSIHLISCDVCHFIVCIVWQPQRHEFVPRVSGLIDEVKSCIQSIRSYCRDSPGGGLQEVHQGDTDGVVAVDPNEENASGADDTAGANDTSLATDVTTGLGAGDGIRDDPGISGTNDAIEDASGAAEGSCISDDAADCGGCVGGVGGGGA